MKNPIKDRQVVLSTKPELLTLEEYKELETIQFVLKTLKTLIPAKSYYYRLPKIFKECLEEK